jgi:heterodisulfide reductase subunit A
MARIGVFVCHCGEKYFLHRPIVPKLPKLLLTIRVLSIASIIIFCVQTRTKLNKEAIQKQKLTGVVVAACSLYARTDFPQSYCRGWTNPYLCEWLTFASIALGCISAKIQQLKKLPNLFASLAVKLSTTRSFIPSKFPLPKLHLLLVGIGGIQAALDIANSGHKVIMVEKIHQSVAKWLNFRNFPNFWIVRNVFLPSNG